MDEPARLQGSGAASGLGAAILDLISHLSTRERQFVDLHIATRLANPLFLKLYERDRTQMEQYLDPEHPIIRMFRYVDGIRGGS